MPGHGEHHPQPQSAVAAARQLTSAVQGLRDDLDDKFSFLRRYGARNRHLIWALAVSLALDLILTAAVIFGQVQLDRNKATIGAVHAAQISACQTGNRLRAEQRALWGHVIAISQPPPHETPVQRRKREKTLTQFAAYVKRVFPTLDCTSVYRIR